MGLLTIALKRISPALCLGYRCVKFTLGLSNAVKPLTVIEKFAVFAVGDLNGKTNIALAWWAFTFVMNKLRNRDLSRRTNQAVIDCDFNNNKVVDLEEVEALIDATAHCKQGDDTVQRAGLYFLRYCLQRYRQGDEDTLRRFGKVTQGKTALDSHACLAAFFGTHASQRLAEQLKGPATPLGAELQVVLDEAYQEIVDSLRNDAIDLLLL